MFKSDVYITRRSKLNKIVKSGLGLFLGNTEAAMNYADNPYHFRQDSDFLYFFGIDIPGFAGVIDFDSGQEMIYGNDVHIDDIIWMGHQPSVKELAAKCGITQTASLSTLNQHISDALGKGRKIHFLPPYRGESKMTLGSLLNENPCKMKTTASVDLIKAVISLRSIKEQVEIEEMEKAIEIAYDMHVTAMRMCKPGVKEQEIFGIIEGIALSKGAGAGFPIILSMNGQTLHNHSHNNILKEGAMMVVDCGAETVLHYTSDITRTTPVGGKFNERQKEIYEIVLNANIEGINASRPGILNSELHLLACRIIASGLKDLGIMKGDVDEAVAEGAHALFMPHGIGHLLGLDAHDMEGLGEKYVGYNDTVQRSNQFGLAYLRFALPFKPGHVFTIEPGCYFIPELIDIWKADSKFAEFINYNKLDEYRNFGGIRIEDNLAITETGHKLLGKPIPKTIAQIEAVCN
jgi:Xaa-Pro aminopeptidase